MEKLRCFVHTVGVPGITEQHGHVLSAVTTLACPLYSDARCCPAFHPLQRWWGVKSASHSHVILDELIHLTEPRCLVKGGVTDPLSQGSCAPQIHSGLRWHCVRMLCSCVPLASPWKRGDVSKETQELVQIQAPALCPKGLFKGFQLHSVLFWIKGHRFFVLVFWVLF